MNLHPKRLWRYAVLGSNRVTDSAESYFRRAVRKTHCPQGHPYDEANTIRHSNGGRNCRACSRASQKRWRERQRTEVPV